MKTLKLLIKTSFFNKIASFGHARTKKHSASGGLCPLWPPLQALPAGGSAPDPRYRLPLRAHHGMRTLRSSKLILKKSPGV